MFCDFDFRGAKLTGTPQHGAKAREQFAKFKWLCEVIVSPMIETANTIFNCVACGQHEDGHPLARFSQLAAYLKTIAARNHDVQDYDVIRVDGRLIEGIVTGCGDVNGIRLFAKAFGHEPCNARIVFDKWKPHASMIRHEVV